jgi:DNA-binding NarL/FixJ family response regulator
MDTMKIKVLLADDTLIAREGWKKILEPLEDVEIVGEATAAQETLAKVKDFQPDVVLMDLMWFEDETAGAAAIARIKQESPQTRVIAITAYRRLIAGARRAGAEAALPKGFSKSELVGHLLRAYPFLANRV